MKTGERNMELKFTAQDYTNDDIFIPSDYEFSGSEENGWNIKRNGEDYLKLGKGYKLLKTKLCGICSTDIDRRFLPFPLPQVTGHELIAMDESTQTSYAVEINDTFEARGDESKDIFCESGIPTHSPTRLVLGIDRLPGGFSPYILAPKNAIVPIGNLSEKTAVLTEPFAAALQAVTSSPPKKGDRVAVLGPRRLGSLVLSALIAYRNSNQIDFEINSIVRHEHLEKLTLELGVDKAINLQKNPDSSLINQFDIVYDTTSTQSGFELALKFAKREVHLKTTNGQEMSGLKKLTELVVDELSILPYTEINLNFHWKSENRVNHIVYVSPNLTNLNLPKDFITFTSNNYSDCSNYLKADIFKNRIPRFDLAIVKSLEEIDFVIRPSQNSEESLVRPRGAILVSPNADTNNSFLNFIKKGGELHSSRCGDFHLAIKLLQENPIVANNLSNKIISDEFPINNLNTAFLKAKDSKSIKVVVKHT
jgi:threonine dehydrogenase-like Zn-dependent dehydrogenase